MYRYSRLCTYQDFVCGCIILPGVGLDIIQDNFVIIRPHLHASIILLYSCVCTCAWVCVHVWESYCGILILPPEGFACTKSKCLCGVQLSQFSWVGIFMRMVTIVLLVFCMCTCVVCVSVYTCVHMWEETLENRPIQYVTFSIVCIYVCLRPCTIG